MRSKTLMNQYLYLAWTKAVTLALVIKVRSCFVVIETKHDPEKQSKLIAHRNKLIAYLNGLGIAVNSDDPRLMTSVRSKLK